MYLLFICWLDYNKKVVSTFLFNYPRVTTTLRCCCLAHCIDLLEVFVEFIDSPVQHVELRTVQNSNFMVTAVSGMAKLLTEN